MSEELEATQGLPDGEAVVETPAIETAPETGTEQTPQAEEKQDDRPKHKPWFQERIDQLTREKYDARREADAAIAKLDEFQRGIQPEGDKTVPQSEIDRIASQRAEELVKAKDFNAKCDAIYSSGKDDFPDFDDKISNFRMLGGLPQPFLEAVTDLPDAQKVLYHLGDNLDDAARILNLPPMRMALELAKLSQAPVKAKPVSNAPPPIRPIDGTPKGEPDPEKMTTNDWIKWREDQLNKRS